MTPVREIENATVFEKPAYNAAYTNVVADSANSRSKRTNSAYDEVNFNSRLRCPIEGRNDVFIEQRVHLGNDARRPSEPRVIALARNQIEAVLGNVHR